MCTWISATSGTSAGTATSSSPVNGQRISCAGVRSSRSEPSSEAVGRNGIPIERGQEPQAERQVAPLLVDRGVALDVLAEHLGDPHRSPIPTQLETSLSAAPRARNSSDS